MMKYAQEMTMEEAIENGRQKWGWHCAICPSDATLFRDLKSVREFYISGMCQACQDGVFGELAYEDEMNG